MAVSEKMIEAIDGIPEFTTEYEYDPETGIDGTSGDIDNPEEVAQAVINAAWTAFDKEEKKTWPKSRGWLLAQSDAKIISMAWFDPADNYLAPFWKYITHHAELKNLLYVKKDENVHD